MIPQYLLLRRERIVLVCQNSNTLYMYMCLLFHSPTDYQPSEDWCILFNIYIYSFRLMSLCWIGIKSKVMCEVCLTVQIVKGVLVRKRRYFVNIEGTPTMTLMFTLEF